jgi:hypothetical protein
MTTLFDPEFFPTPATVVHLMLSKISSGARYFLEPSAGKGDIAEGIKKRYPYAKVDCIEQSPELIRSLSDAKIATIVRWVDGGSAMGDSKDLPPLKNFPEDDGWQLSKIYGQPDLVLKSDSYTMPAHGQDVWFKPLTEVTLSEPRWVRAVEMRPGTIAGRKIMHHVLARLIQEEPAAVVTAGAAADGGQRGPANGMGHRQELRHLSSQLRQAAAPRLAHLVGTAPARGRRGDSRSRRTGGVFYPKGETPKYRTYLTLFSGTPSFGSGIDIAPNSIAESQGFHLLRQPARLENFQPHMHLRGKAMSMEAILRDGTTHFNFNWMNNYIYAEDAAPVLPKGTLIHVTAWHDNTRANPNNPDPDQ